MCCKQGQYLLLMTLLILYFFTDFASSLVYGYSIVSVGAFGIALFFDPEINNQTRSNMIANVPLHKTLVDVTIGSSTTLSAIMSATISGVKPR